MAGEEISNKQVVLRKYASAVLKESDMEVRTSKIRLQLKEGSDDVLVKNLYLSPDPYMRGRMNEDHTSYIPCFKLGQPINGFGVSKVVLSNNPNFKEGDYVTSFANWEEYSFIPGGQQLKVVDPSLAPLSYHLGCLGMPGFTAYIGLYEVLKAKKGDTIFVSAASGAVGQLVGQLAKHLGLHVVGSAGSQEKIKLLKSKLGYDEAFNYKEEKDLVAALKKYCPNGIDLYFENVGGEMLEAVLETINVHGRIAVCGLISQVNVEETAGPKNFKRVIYKRVTIQGFLQSDYPHLKPQFMELMAKYLKEGQLEYIEDFSEGLDNAPAAFYKLLKGTNVGKQIITIAKQ